jgi:hypothetical protein
VMRRVTVVMLMVSSLGCRRDPALAAPVNDDAPKVLVDRGDAPPIVDQLLPPGWEPGPPRWRASGVDERLVIREGGTELGFAEWTCAHAGNCGCVVPATHHYSRVNGRWKIVVVLSQVEIERVVVPSTCEASCGVQPPPDPRPIRSLGEVDPREVQIVEERPRLVIQEATCTDMMVRP